MNHKTRDLQVLFYYYLAAGAILIGVMAGRAGVRITEAPFIPTGLAFVLLIGWWMALAHISWRYFIDGEGDGL